MTDLYVSLKIFLTKHRDIFVIKIDIRVGLYCVKDEK